MNTNHKLGTNDSRTTHVQLTN